VEKEKKKGNKKKEKKIAMNVMLFQSFP